MKEQRKKIDSLDRKISSLLDERAALVRKIGDIKKSGNTEVFVPSREREIINNILSVSSEDGYPPESKISIFSEIFAASRALQKKLRISYLGPEATFTHLAAEKKFSRACEYAPALSISQVFRDVEKGRSDYGVVPVENSTEGAVSYTLDMFISSSCRICAEMLMEVSHSLLSKAERLDSVKTVYSHPQAIAQCRIWLEENLEGVKYVEVSSTAKAARMASEDETSAAIASVMAAELYGLGTLAEKIEDAVENITRFFVISKNIPESSGRDKTTIMFSVKDRVGVLHDMLLPFKKKNLNMTKIESRPSRAKAWEYVFFIDFLGHVSDPGVREVLEELQKDCAFLKVVGSYPAADETL